MTAPTPEHQRLEEDRNGDKAWKKWGPYLSERQWGTVREDYSANGDAWSYFPHDMARISVMISSDCACHSPCGMAAIRF